jgi:hypothetical protein
MNLLLIAILFFIFSPSTIRLPIGGGKYFVTFVHSTLFALTIYLIYSHKYLEGLEIKCNELSKHHCNLAKDCWWLQGVVKGCAYTKENI